MSDAIPLTQNESEKSEQGVKTDTQQTVIYTDEQAGTMTMAPPISDPSFTANYAAGADLADYLSRPVVIQTVDWVEGTQFSLALNPWEAYFSNANIIEKISSYAYINCKLKLKIVINAAPFYYGCAIASYQPQSGLNPAAIVQLSSFDGWLIPLSQRPHVWLYPQCNQGGELELPFIHTSDWLRVGFLSEFAEMGALTIKSYTSLDNANSVAGVGCSIQVLAWAEDVHLCGPTVYLPLQALHSDYIVPGEPPVANPELPKNDVRNLLTTVLKPVRGKPANKSTSRKIKERYDIVRADAKADYKVYTTNRPLQSDEYSTSGKISGPASAIADATGKLGNVPVIGPYMTASSVIATKVGQIASLFGFTNTPVVDDVKPVKSMNFHSFASTEIGQPVDKMTIDPKNEITIDPRVVGLSDNDDMSLWYLLSRESYLTQFDWLASDATGQKLFSTLVTPNLYRAETTTITAIQATPLHHFSSLFRFWRGSIIFRFRFICTKYHKGRVVISWDPYANLDAAPPNLETNYSKIVDISECTDIEIEVPYLAATSWLTRRQLQPGVTLYGSGAIAAPSTDTDNGSLFISVFTEQTSPVASSAIPVMVSVRAGNNFDVANPDDQFDFVSYYPPQADVISYDAPSCEQMFQGGKPAESISLVYNGEKIVSLRQLLRRTCFEGAYTWTFNSTFSEAVLTLIHNRSPRYFGYDPSGLNTALSILGGPSAPFNFVAITPYTLCAPCFIARRGSYNYNFNFDGIEYCGSMSVTRSNEAGAGIFLGGLTSTGWDQRARFYSSGGETSGAPGKSLLNQRTQTGCAVSLPMYSKYRMLSNNPDYATQGTSEDDSTDDQFEFQAHLHPLFQTTQASSYPTLYTYYSIGSDFSLMGFLNVPTMYYYASYPSAP
jgi:hypothetical protein